MKLLSLALTSLLLTSTAALAGDPDPAAQYKAIQEAGKAMEEINSKKEKEIAS